MNSTPDNISSQGRLSGPGQDNPPDSRPFDKARNIQVNDRFDGPDGAAHSAPTGNSPDGSHASRRKTYDAIALFSGGLDSILTVKVLEEQGLRVKALHFFTPFFGKPQARKYWERLYNIDLTAVDLGDDFADLLKQGPTSGFGKVLNPCVDCKILLLRRAKALLPHYGATFLATGEVMGQRPMSQRRDTLNRISREADVRDCLLRPLSARLLPPTPMEEDGRVNRELLCDISGRGRNAQFELAKRFNITEFPTPAGGCRLAEMENARRYWPVLQYLPDCTADDFYLANLGRQFWHGRHWLSVGRNATDNEALEKLARPADFIFKTLDFPGPLSLGRPTPGADWDEATQLSAAALAASFSPKARQYSGPLRVRITQGESSRELVIDSPQTAAQTAAALWHALTWEEVKPEIHALRKQPAKPPRSDRAEQDFTAAGDALEPTAGLPPCGPDIFEPAAIGQTSTPHAAAPAVSQPDSPVTAARRGNSDASDQA